MTVLRFSGGETVRVGLEVSRVQELLQQALAEGVLLELEGPDGSKLVINPVQVQFLQAADEAPAHRNSNGTRVPAGA